MGLKRVLCPERVRRLPAQFSWVDQRLVRERYLERCDAPAAALYLFLVTVADVQGLSYYSEPVLGRHLSLPVERLRRARADLQCAGLIAYERPLYQVLGLDGSACVPGRELGARETIEERIGQLRARLTSPP